MVWLGFLTEVEQWKPIPHRPMARRLDACPSLPMQLGLRNGQ
jgi:hypothetical protein